MPLLYEVLQVSEGEITHVAYPTTASAGSQVRTEITVYNPQADGVVTYYLARLINAVTLVELAIAGWFQVNGQHAETYGLINFVMPNQSLACLMELRVVDESYPGRGRLIDTFGPFTINIALITLTIRSSPISGVPVVIDGVQSVTPAYLDVSEGTYTVIVPSVVEKRSFIRWENNSQEPQRQIIISGPAEITSYYGEPSDGEESFLEKYKYPILAGVGLLGLLGVISLRRK